jgi:hypothetical protein
MQKMLKVKKSNKSQFERITFKNSPEEVLLTREFLAD